MFNLPVYILVLCTAYTAAFDECGKTDDKGMWIPNKQGLGFRYVYDTLNSLYGNRFVEYNADKMLF